MSVRKPRVEPLLGARVVGRTALFYAHGVDAELDRPAHVRAGSALARLGPTTLAVVQDDAGFLAVLEGVGTPALVVRDVPLPSHDGVRQFDDSRGNKNAKLDLEACLTWGGMLVAFGSGSSPMRERVALVKNAAYASPRVTVVEAYELYELMRNHPIFPGSELNIEGAALAGDDVLFLQRGNGARVGQHEPVDASVRVDRAALLAYLNGLARGDGIACPPLREVVQWDLGSAGGTRLTFTDAVAASGRWTAFLACAEASPDATHDGPVAGVAIGRLDDRRGEAEMGMITDERGAPLVDKAEGITLDDHDPRRAWLVIDRDDPGCPAELLELRLGERWAT